MKTLLYFTIFSLLENASIMCQFLKKINLRKPKKKKKTLRTLFAYLDFSGF